MARVPAFQAGYAGSIPVTRSIAIVAYDPDTVLKQVPTAGSDCW